MRKISISLALIAALFASPALADFTGKNAAGTTITFKNPGDCTSVVCVPEMQLVDASGAAVAPALDASVQSVLTTLGLVAGSPVSNTIQDRLKVINTTLGTLATSSAQTTGNTSLGTIATNSGTQATAANQTTGNTSLATIATNSGTQATAANQTTANTSLATIATNSALPLPAQSTHIVNVGAVDSINEYPATAVPYTASATGTTAATTATLAGASSVTTYICGMSVRSNATAAATGNITVTGVISATMNFTHWTAPLASGIGITEMIFKPCVPASGTNQSVAVVSPAPGTGGVISVTAWGYKL